VWFGRTLVKNIYLYHPSVFIPEIPSFVLVKHHFPSVDFFKKQRSEGTGKPLNCKAKCQCDYHFLPYSSRRQKNGWAPDTIHNSEEPRVDKCKKVKKLENSSYKFFLHTLAPADPGFYNDHSQILKHSAAWYSWFYLSNKSLKCGFILSLLTSGSLEEHIVVLPYCQGIQSNKIKVIWTQALQYHNNLITDIAS
jgi:hypothetical protein